LLRFEHIEYAWALLLVPAAILLFILARIKRKKALQRFGDLPLIQQLTSEASKSKPVIKFVLAVIALTALVIGIMNPQIGSKLSEVKREGSDLIIALDVSNSMKAEDLSPNRLEKAKQAIEKLIDKLQGDRLGIIVFAGEAYVQLPITSDYTAAKLFLRNIDTDIVPTQGTAIGSAIELAAKSFGEDTKGKNRALIIITDGETHDEGAIDAAKEAEDKGIVIHTIGMGSVQGAPIPVYRNKVQVGYHKDQQGNTVITKLNEPMLQDLAKAGDGIFVRASNAEAGLNIVLSEINKLDKQEFESKRFSSYEDRFYYFIAFALILLVIEALLSERRSKWVEKVDLFGEKKGNKQ
jgi:Ca-activated chloride channel family protein